MLQDQEKERIRLAIDLRKRGEDVEDIVNLTGLSQDFVETL